MHIDSYDFGRMVVDGEVYTADLILLPGSVIGNWRRVQGHRLAVEDLKEMAGHPPSLLVVGTGMYGRMAVPEETLRYLKEKGINALVRKTTEAAKSFNEQAEKGGVAGAFHLTC